MDQETVLITGASAGIGRELAKLFAAEGAHLVLAARRRDRLDELAAELARSHGSRVTVHETNLATAGAARRLHEALNQAGVQVDVLVNNAGFGVLSRVTDLPLERLTDMLQVNMVALTQLTRLFLPGMIVRRRGGVLNVASTAAFQAGPNMAVYYATKTYILHFTEALAEELRGTGVTASCLCPGPTLTEFQSVAGMDDSPIFRMGPMLAAPVASIGHRGFRRGKTIVVAGWRNWLGTCAVKFAPRRFVRRVVHGLNRLLPKADLPAPPGDGVDPGGRGS